MAEAKRLLVVGAHPDDGDFRAGGLAALWLERGGEARFLSLTDGSAGHATRFGPELAARRREEAEAAAATIGIAYEIWDVPDGRLEPALALRERLIRTVRAFRPDLILTHRPNDYHPDHRYTSILLQDAAYLLTVPAICPDVPHLPAMPAIGYLYDGFLRPQPFRADVAIDVGPVLEKKVAMLLCHASQFLEWLPSNMPEAAGGPPAPGEVEAWARRFILARMEEVAERSEEALARRYGCRGSRAVRYAEAFEASEYGAPWKEERVAVLFGP